MKLIEFSKTECGVDFLMKVGPKKDLKGNISDVAPFKSDFFEIFFSGKVTGGFFLVTGQYLYMTIQFFSYLLFNGKMGGG